MAAILEKILLGDIQSSDVINWLVISKVKENLPACFVEFENLKGEFVPYFINFLRDQTSQVLNGSKSANTTPAKTPLSAKFKRQLSKHSETGDRPCRAPVKNGRHSSSNRVQLFNTADSQRKDNQESTSYSYCESSNIAENLSRTSLTTNDYSSGRRQGRFVSPQPGCDFTPRSQRSIHFQTPDSHSQRSRSKHSLGDFFTPESEKKNRSLHFGKKDDNFTPPQQYKRSGGRKSSEKKARGRLNTTPPDFSLSNADDFPTLGGAASTSTPKPLPADGSRLPGLPEGVQVITPSRRITPTLIRSGKSAKLESPLAGSLASFHSPSAGMGWKTNAPSPFKSQALTFQTPKQQGKQDSIEDERQFLKALKGGQVSLESPFVDTSSFGEQHTPPQQYSQQSFPARDQDKPQAVLSPQAVKVERKVEVGDLPIPRRLTTEKVEETANQMKASDDKICTANGGDRVNMDRTPVKALNPDGPLLVTPTKAVLDRQPSVTESVKVDAGQVTHKAQLDALASLYSSFIAENLVPNLTVELYFIMQLLTSRAAVDMEIPCDPCQDIDEVQYFCSVHNAVYFAVAVLANHKPILNLLDKSTLRLLVDNQRLADFDPQLVTDLARIHEQCPARITPVATSSPIGGVSFQAETDNRYNFPNDTSFHVFRKQRDTFYELIRIWQENHMTSGWSLVETEGRRIFDLVTQKTSLANHIHLARLFQSQLLHMCKGDNSVVVEEDDQNISLLVQLKRSNPDKFKRLQGRFIAPSSLGGPCPPPTFQGCQEFFRDFLLAASSAPFYQHLGDTMTAKITALNDAEYNSHENVEEDTDVEERECLAQSLFALRLLGRFLGFLHYLPYRCLDPLPSQITNDYIANRNQTSCRIDLLHFVKKALQYGHTVVTIPWVVEYLSMIDSLAPQLDYVLKVLELLLHIHRFAKKHFGEKQSHAEMLVVLYLGWMFELQMFPEGLFFKEVPDDNDIKAAPSGCLDSSDLVDQRILYSCCPYLGEVRSVLVDFAVGTSSKKVNSVRKITPVPTQPQSNVAVSEKQLQTQLEENFFHNHPASLKRTVEFVADRVASNHIKKFRSEGLTAALTTAYQEAKESAVQSLMKSSDDKAKRNASSLILSKSSDICLNVRNNDKQQADKYCCQKVKDILCALLPEETSPHVHDACAKISLRMALEKINMWMNTHITPAMFKREMTAEFDKTCKTLAHKFDRGDDDVISNKQNSPVKLSKVSDAALEKSADRSGSKSVIKKCDTNCEYQTGSLRDETDGVTYLKLPSDLLAEMKDAISDVILYDKVVEGVPVIKNLLLYFKQLYRHGEVVLIPSAEKTMARLTIDLAFYLVIHDPAVWQKELEDLFLELWSTDLVQHVHFDHVICIKHLHPMYQRGGDSMSSLIRFVSLLLCNNLVCVDKLSSNCVVLLTLDLNCESLRTLCELLCGIIAQYHADSGSDSDETFSDLIDAMFQCGEAANDDVIKRKVTIVLDKIRTAECENSSVIN